jgi:hypothetical protein
MTTEIAMPTGPGPCAPVYMAAATGASTPRVTNAVDILSNAFADSFSCSFRAS